VSRPPRAGIAGRPVTIRATDAERASWMRAAVAEGQATLSAWIVKILNNRAQRANFQGENTDRNHDVIMDLIVELARELASLAGKAGAK
jgi:hypothetical protein